MLLGLSMYWYSARMEVIVRQSDRKVGPELVRADWLETHSNIEWQLEHRDAIQAGEVLDPSVDESAAFYRDLLESNRTLGSQFESYVIFPQDPQVNPKGLNPPQHHDEAEILQRAMARIAEERPADPPDDQPQPRGLYALLIDDPIELPAGHDDCEVTIAGKKMYRYYQPLFADSSCVLCHRSLGKLPRPSLIEGDLMGVVRVEIDRDATSKLAARNYSLLWTAAIVIGLLSMLLMYFIVRYVIVKPVQHLRDVANAVREGDVEQRADIHTGDEFEELAAAFNRMLRRLLRQQDDLQDVNGELDAKLDQLAQANMRLFEMNRVKSDFLATMSHELRTPLNSILGFSDVLSTIDALDDKQQRYVGNIQRSGKMLLEMINDILDLAKVESGKMDIRPTEFRIESVVAAQCDMARPLSERKNIDLVCDCPEGLPPMRQDQAKLQQVLNNLLSNAIKFTPEGGRIEVSAARDSDPTNKDGGMLRMTVRDTGIGISDDDQQLVFEKFRQGAGAAPDGGVMTREQSGAGLGLSIVRELCRLLGGEVSLDSTVGKGSTFIVHLPWTLSMSKNLDAELQKEVAELTRASAL